MYRFTECPLLAEDRLLPVLDERQLWRKKVLKLDRSAAGHFAAVAGF
jgi:hypothetical protein